MRFRARSSSAGALALGDLALEVLLDRGARLRQERRPRGRRGATRKPDAAATCGDRRSPSGPRADDADGPTRLDSIAPGDESNRRAGRNGNRKAWSPSPVPGGDGRRGSGAPKRASRRRPRRRRTPRSRRPRRRTAEAKRAPRSGEADGERRRPLAGRDAPQELLADAGGRARPCRRPSRRPRRPRTGSRSARRGRMEEARAPTRRREAASERRAPGEQRRACQSGVGGRGARGRTASRSKKRRTRLTASQAASAIRRRPRDKRACALLPPGRLVHFSQVQAQERPGRRDDPAHRQRLTRRRADARRRRRKGFRRRTRPA